MSDPTRTIDGIRYVLADYHDERVKFFRDKWLECQGQVTDLLKYSPYTKKTVTSKAQEAAGISKEGEDL